MSEIATVGVVGGGLMGSGIAQVAALAGFTTIVRELSPALCERARAAIGRGLDTAVTRAKITAAARDAALERTTISTELDAFGACDVVVEAVVEEIDVKNAVWRDLDPVCPAHTIFASNTSSLTIAAMAAAARPDRMIGLHFFSPVPVMRLVEVVRTVTTSDDTFTRTLAFARRLGKEPIVAKDNAGFIVNLLLIPYLLDAVRALERGVATVADIDTGMQLGTGHPMGPFTLLDYVGIDTVYRVAEIMFTEYRETRYAPPPLLRRMVLAGYHGRKTGCGFYDYRRDPPEPMPLGI